MWLRDTAGWLIWIWQPSHEPRLPLTYFDSLGVPRLFVGPSIRPNRRMRTRIYGGAAGRVGDHSPYADPNESQAASRFSQTGVPVVA
jgi:hypothetical protein